MRCDFCGGEVDVAGGYCIECGRAVSGNENVRIAHEVKDLTEHYDVGDREELENLPALLSMGTYKRQTQTQEKPQERRYYGPALGLKDYQEMLCEDEAELHEDSIDAVVSDSEAVETAADALPGDGNAQAETGGAENVVQRAYNKVDAAFAPAAEKVLDAYHRRFPQMKRVKRSAAVERLAVFGVFLLSIAAVVFIAWAIFSAIAPSVRGVWLVGETSSGETLTIEFAASSKVIVRTIVDGEEHIYQQGTYKKRRKNGNNLLTIFYDDGSVSRLYYERHRGYGVFTNVDSNKSATYYLIN